MLHIEIVMYYNTQAIYVGVYVLFFCLFVCVLVCLFVPLWVCCSMLLFYPICAGPSFGRLSFEIYPWSHACMFLIRTCWNEPSPHSNACCSECKDELCSEVFFCWCSLQGPAIKFKAKVVKGEASQSSTPSSNKHCVQSTLTKVFRNTLQEHQSSLRAILRHCSLVKYIVSATAMLHMWPFLLVFQI